MRCGHPCAQMQHLHHTRPAASCIPGPHHSRAQLGRLASCSSPASTRQHRRRGPCVRTAAAAASNGGGGEGAAGEGEQDFMRSQKMEDGRAFPVLLTGTQSEWNPNIGVWQIPESWESEKDGWSLANARILILDPSGNLHSIYWEDRVLTGRYWDYLAVLPAAVPPGPLALLGLGAGTCARAMAAYFPERALSGWEWDQVVVDAAREHMGLQALEDAGQLTVHVGDALDAEAVGAHGPYAGIVVDLFSGGALLPQLQGEAAWNRLRALLAPGGRLIVNVGAYEARAPADWGHNAASAAALTCLSRAFPGELHVRPLVLDDSTNLLALTGPAPDFGALPADMAGAGLGAGWVPWDPAMLKPDYAAPAAPAPATPEPAAAAGGGGGGFEDQD